MELLVLGLVVGALFFLAWTANTYPPQPIGLIAAVVISVLALIYLIGELPTYQ